MRDYTLKKKGLFLARLCLRANLFSPSLVEKGQLPDTTEGCRLRDFIRTPRGFVCDCDRRTWLLRLGDGANRCPVGIHPPKPAPASDPGLVMLGFALVWYRQVRN